MRRALDLRITHWGWKLLYAVAVYVLATLPNVIAPQTEPMPFLARGVSALLLIGGCLLGARIFRGTGEPVAPARPWWQMTARAKLSRRVGILFTVGVALLLLSAVLEASGGGWATIGGLPISIIAILENAVLAFLYLNSGIRLRQRGDASAPAPPAPTFKPRRIPIR